MQRGYYSTLDFRLVVGFDTVVADERDFSYNTGFGLLGGLHLGISRTWSWEFGAILHGIGSHARIRVDGEWNNATADDLALQTAIGWKRLVSDRAFCVVQAGLTSATTRIAWGVLDEGDGTIHSTALSAPISIHLTYGDRFLVAPMASVAYVWNGRSTLTTIGPGPYPDNLDRTHRRLAPYLTESLGLDVGAGAVATWLGLVWQHAPAVDGNDPYDLYLVRFTWNPKFRTREK